MSGRAQLQHIQARILRVDIDGAIAEYELELSIQRPGYRDGQDRIAALSKPQAEDGPP